MSTKELPSVKRVRDYLGNKGSFTAKERSAIIHAYADGRLGDLNNIQLVAAAKSLQYDDYTAAPEDVPDWDDEEEWVRLIYVGRAARMIKAAFGVEEEQ